MAAVVLATLCPKKSVRGYNKRPWVGTSATLTILALTGAPISCDRAYAQVLTDFSEDQYKKVQVLPHPHDLGYPLGYSRSFCVLVPGYTGLGQLSPRRGKFSRATELPPHMLNQWEDSKLELGNPEREALRQLLLRYQDVFTASEFDLGDFTAVS
ncbi:hypothetical protein PoB_005166500 [Plakobranchus ocellatus]|uniref:Uncharacterized protein n=1 Tax=Plakobranchus ocellatus TaxID=259542 RepID=A0AAV4C0N0_9GAST|nr:hypothetical protein PoB_005166500 [Plakobranchus ocellatus]